MTFQFSNKKIMNDRFYNTSIRFCIKHSIEIQSAIDGALVQKRKRKKKSR